MTAATGVGIRSDLGAFCQLDDTTEIFGTHELAADEATAHATDFVAVEIVERVPDDGGWRGRTGMQPVSGQHLERLRRVLVGHNVTKSRNHQITKSPDRQILLVSPSSK